MTTATVTIRAALPVDAVAIARIYNEGIEDRIATFETRLRTPGDIEARIAGGERLLVAERSGAVVGFAGWAPYSDREAYAGVGNYTVYVARGARGARVGSALMREVVAEAETAGLWKLLSIILATNEASIALARRHGFREVGRHRRHGKLDGEWRDAVLVELSLGAAAG
jgi:L-amino acid N-acyltransferase YncA